MTANYEDFSDASAAAADAGDFKLALELLERYRNYRLVQLWCRAEQHDVDRLPEEEREKITARIHARVADGPGDLAVDAVLLMHELRDIDDKQYDVVKKTVGNRGSVQRLHVYDSFVAADFHGDAGFLNLFGNANIGFEERSNLQVPGQITFHRVLLTSWYVTTIPVRDWVPGTVALQIGSKQLLTATVTQLIKRPQRLVKEVPVRQNVGVRYSSGHDEHKLPPPGVRVYVHLEGWEAVPLV